MSGLPRIIHFCWVGDSKLSDLNRECMATWSAVMPDYEIRRWDELNFPGELTADQQEFYDRAMEHRCYSNVSNMVRLITLQKYGGIYLDTDVEVLRPIHEAYDGEDLLCGWESDVFVNNAVLAATGDNWVLQGCLDRYGKEIEFKRRLGSRNTRTVLKLDGSEPSNFSGPWLITDVLLHGGFSVLSECEQHKRGVTVVPRPVFYPLPWAQRKNQDAILEARRNPHAFTLHRWEGTWQSEDWK